jgi:integrase
VPHIPRLKVQNVRTGFFEREQFDAVVAALPAYLKDFARFGYLTGWRKGEIRSLTWRDLDREGGVIRLRAEAAKNGRGRLVPLDGDLAALMERRWQARLLTASDGSPRVVDAIFHRAGQPIGDIKRAWASACVAAGLYHIEKDARGNAVKVPDRLFHDLRRTAVRNMVRAGVAERVAMEISGHRTRSVFDRYNIVSEADLRAAVQKTAVYLARPAVSEQDL